MEFIRAKVEMPRLRMLFEGWLKMEEWDGCGTSEDKGAGEGLDSRRYSELWAGNKLGVCCRNWVLEIGIFFCLYLT